MLPKVKGFTDLHYAVLVRLNLTDKAAKADLDIDINDYRRAKADLLKVLGVDDSVGAVFKALELGLIQSPYTDKRTLQRVLDGSQVVNVVI
jgi:hypothetical protein